MSGSSRIEADNPAAAEAFLLHLSKRLCHVFHLIPDIKAYVDRRGLLSRHRDTIAGPRIDLDDLLLVQFVLCTEDKSRKIDAALETLTIILSIFAPSARKMFASRSWVSGAPFACLA
jgi:hypothetical protein